MLAGPLGGGSITPAPPALASAQAGAGRRVAASGAIQSGIATFAHEPRLEGVLDVRQALRRVLRDGVPEQREQLGDRGRRKAQGHRSDVQLPHPACTDIDGADVALREPGARAIAIGCEMSLFNVVIHRSASPIVGWRASWALDAGSRGLK